MKYRLLGNSGLRVSEAVLGTMTFGEDWGWGTAKDEARKVYDASREAGGNFVDTANLYTNGTRKRSSASLSAFDVNADHRAHSQAAQDQLLNRRQYQDQNQERIRK